MPSSDSELIEKAKEDAEAFGELYQRYVDRIYNYIFHRTGSVEDAQDLTAHTFYKAMTHIGRYRERGAPFAAWLYRIAHNAVANWHRDNSRWTELPLEGLTFHDQPENAPDAAAEHWERQQALSQAMRRLHPDRQTLLILKFGEGLSNRQIGDIMGRSEGAIKSLYHRALVGLREDLEAQGFTIYAGDGKAD
ncbi:MAG: RNA polymerase sigma factor [Anaerolineae bacterium]